MYDVKVKIDLVKPVGKASFGFPLILAIGTAKDYAECTSIEDVVTAGFDDKTDAYKAAALMFSQNNPPASVAVMGVASTENISEALANKGFRQLVLVGGEASDVTAVATYINTTNDKLFFATITKDNISTIAEGERKIYFVHDNALASAALVGEAAGRTVGSFTYKNLILNGIEPMEYGDADLKTIHEKKAFTFVEKAGDNVTSEGITANGDYIDDIDIQDYIVTQLTYRTQSLLNKVGKIPYDNKGISQLELVAKGVLKDAYDNGMIATNDDGTPAYSVDYALREATDASDRAARKYVGGKFSFKLAGAVHEVEITGEIEI